MPISKSIIDAISIRLQAVNNLIGNYDKNEMKTYKEQAEWHQDLYNSAIQKAAALQIEKQELQQFLKDNDETGEPSIPSGE